MELYTLLDAVSSAVTGNTFTLREMHRTFQVIQSATDSTVITEASNDGTNWVTLRTTTNASEGFSTAEPWHYVRARVSSYGSGTITVIASVSDGD